jgi:hypothetical protein
MSTWSRLKMTLFAVAYTSTVTAGLWNGLNGSPVSKPGPRRAICTRRGGGPAVIRASTPALARGS